MLGFFLELGLVAVNLYFALCVDKTPALVTLNAVAAGWCLAFAWQMVKE